MKSGLGLMVPPPQAMGRHKKASLVLWSFPFRVIRRCSGDQEVSESLLGLGKESSERQVLGGKYKGEEGLHFWVLRTYLVHALSPGWSFCP